MGKHAVLAVLFVTFSIMAIATPVAAEARKLTLEECLLRAVGSSLEVRSGRFLAPVARTGITEAESEFDQGWCDAVRRWRSNGLPEIN